MEDAAQSGSYSTPYKFTGKELDKETGWYYFGARYLDPKLAVWVSVDLALAKYLPTKKDEKLPGLGGVFNSVNLNVYHYAGNNPVKFIDLDGNETYIFITRIIILGAYTKNYNGPIENRERKEVPGMPLFLVAVKHYGKVSASPLYLFAFTRHRADYDSKTEMLSENAWVNPGGLFEGVMRDKGEGWGRVLQLFSPTHPDNKGMDMPGYIWNLNDEDLTSSFIQFHRDGV